MVILYLFFLFIIIIFLIDPKSELKLTTDTATKFIPTVELTESELNSFIYSNKRFTFIDIYHNGDTINKVFF